MALYVSNHSDVLLYGITDPYTLCGDGSQIRRDGTRNGLAGTVGLSLRAAYERWPVCCYPSVETDGNKTDISAKPTAKGETICRLKEIENCTIAVCFS